MILNYGQFFKIIVKAHGQGFFQSIVLYISYTYTSKAHSTRNSCRMRLSIFIYFLCSFTQINGFIISPHRFNTELNRSRPVTPSNEIEIYSMMSETSPPPPIPPPPPLPPYYIVNKLDPKLKKMYESLIEQSLEIYENISNKTWKKIDSKDDRGLYVRVH